MTAQLALFADTAAAPARPGELARKAGTTGAA